MNNFSCKSSLVGLLLLLSLLAFTKTRSNQIPMEEEVMTANMTAVDNATNLEFKIRTDSSIYGTDDKILLRMRITNTNDSSIVINRRFIINDPTVSVRSASGEVYLIITSATGDTLSFPAFVDVDYPDDADYIELRPREAVEARYIQDINEYYEFSKKGEYQITAYYYNYFSKGIKLKPWQGKIKSNILTILIQ